MAKLPNAPGLDPTAQPTTAIAAETDVLQRLLRQPAAGASAANTNGASAATAMPPGSIVMGRIESLDAAGLPYVSHYGGSAVPRLAMSLIALELSFPAGAEGQPLVLGVIWSPGPLATHGHAAEVIADGDVVTVQASQYLTLRCGAASLTLTADGQILLRGAYISSHSTGTQRIKGAAVKIN
jgi:hypothetical protein